MKKLFCLAVLVLLPAPKAAADVFTDCQRVINNLPVTISSPGTYCLERNLSTSIATGSAITIAANHVTVDLKGHRIDGSSAGAGTLASGVGTSGTHSGVVVRNGVVRGFSSGVSVFGNSVIVEDISAESNTFAGIQCSGTACTVRRNEVTGTGGAVLGPPGVEASVGISNGSDGGATYDNMVSGFINTSVQFPHAIEVGQWGVGTIVRNNKVIGPGTSLSVGIFVSPAGVPPLHASVLVAGNDILGFQTGVKGSPIGVSCRATQNRAAGVTTAVDGCVDAGDNN